MNEVSDLVRLLVLPLIGWAAWRDFLYRRAYNFIWYIVAGVGFVAFFLDFFIYRSYAQVDLAITLLLSVVLVGGLGFVFAYYNFFGWADGGAFMSIAVLYPIVPLYSISNFQFPMLVLTSGVFSITIISNTAIISVFSPLYSVYQNVIRDSLVFPQSFFSIPFSLSDLSTRHGLVMIVTKSGWKRSADIDVIRMYLRWRQMSPEFVAENSSCVRHPDGIGEVNSDIDDGRVELGLSDDPLITNEYEDVDDLTGDYSNPWGVDDFYEDIPHSMYGCRKNQLVESLDSIFYSNDRDIRLSIGHPYLLYVLLGTLVAILFGNVLLLIL